MRVVKASEIQEMDRITIQELGIPGAVLMENAARGAYMINPITGANNADRYMFTVFDSATDWVNFVGEVVTSPAGQNLARHRNKIMDCNLSLWNSQVMVGSLVQE